MISLKNTCTWVALRMFTLEIVGACVSGKVSKMEFCVPGVPPFGFKDAAQLLLLVHACFGLINSKVQPPSSLAAS